MTPANAPHRIPLRRPSPALVVACIALLVALGGTSYAAITLPRDSVGAVQIKRGAVTSSEVRDGSLGVVDLSAGARSALRGQTGPQGPAGTKGDKGDPGPAGITGLERVTNASPLNSSPEKAVIATCPANKRLIGGGASIWARTMIWGTDGAAPTTSQPLDDRTWVAVAHEIVDTDEDWFLQVVAICATVHP